MFSSVFHQCQWLEWTETGLFLEMMPSSRCKLDFKCLSLVRTRRECMRRSCFANISFPTINISILGTAPSADVTHYWVTTMMRGRRRWNTDQELKCDKKKVFHLRTNPSCGPRSHHAGPCGARCRQGAEVCQGRELDSTIQLTSENHFCGILMTH